LDLFPVRLSLAVAFLGTLLTVVSGLPLAWLLARRRFPGHDTLEAAVVLPLVLPPTVLGYYLLVLVSRRGPLAPILDQLGIEIAFTWKAAVLAAWVGSYGMFVKAAQGGLELVDARLEQAARTLGRSEWSILITVTLPLAWRAVLAGAVVSFARSLGEFGITLMVAGSIPGVTQTMPLAIYDAVQAGRLDDATRLSLVAIAIAAALLLGVSRLARVRV